MEALQVAIHPDFEKLIPALSEDEFNQLEQNILAEGIRDSLVVWRGILIDGHNRYRIADKHNLEYDVIEKEFENEEKVKEWIILNQFGRRNLSAYQRSVLALALEELFKDKAKENKLIAAEKMNGTFCQKSDETMKPVDTKRELAKIAGVSHDTIAKVKKIEQSAPSEVKQKVQSGQISINEAYREIKKEEKKELVKQKEQDYKEEIKEVSDFDIDIYTTDKKFNIIYADPPWRYWEGGEKNQSLHYPTMSVDELKAMPVADIADDNCILFLWVTFPILRESLELLESWGFKYSTCGFVWVKKNKHADSYFFSNGAWTRANSELCLIGTKGSVTRIDASISQVIDDPVSDHSEKPPRVRDLITTLVGELPRIELFSRNKNSDGWFNFGNSI